ncbi:DNA polymerase III subunit delta' [Algicella marina]|uniref:DNA polymerase III subunit delta n=1 Tax=Algicella marina TaxID=2683284 RepID=A0A6P1T305_9RHOB|nr:DNA polymerase III subunit delta' [Algicella marina]QHQ34892.1 DNA polymerase III subunit delta' [Algicella marina]
MSEEPLPEADKLDAAAHPRHTSELFGQNEAEATFLEAYNSERLHHGWLLTGPRGVGKATLAWRIARFVLRGDEGGLFGPPADLAIDPETPAFRRTAALSEPGLMLCRRAYDEKAKRLKIQLTVEEVRKLKHFFEVSATDGGWRVAIVDAADEMNTAAANALLKILEEPPAKALLLLVCHRPARLLPTIRSRCRTLKLRPLGNDDLVAALASLGHDASLGPVETMLAAGSVGEALRVLEGDGASLYLDILALLGSARQLDTARVLALADKAAGRGSEAAYDLILRLTGLALARMARAGAGGEALLPQEQEVAEMLCPGLQPAQAWAEALQDIEARAAHARAVNIDPAQVILDSWIAISRAARSIAA